MRSSIRHASPRGRRAQLDGTRFQGAAACRSCTREAAEECSGSAGGVRRRVWVVVRRLFITRVSGEGCPAVGSIRRHPIRLDITVHTHIFQPGPCTQLRARVKPTGQGTRRRDGVRAPTLARDLLAKCEQAGWSQRCVPRLARKCEQVACLLSTLRPTTAAPSASRLAGSAASVMLSRWLLTASSPNAPLVGVIFCNLRPAPSRTEVSSIKSNPLVGRGACVRSDPNPPRAATAADRSCATSTQRDRSRSIT